MSEKPDLRVANQKAAIDAVQQSEQLSDEELRQTILTAFKSQGYPGDELPPGLDTSREGLLDLVAGIAAIAQATPAD